MKNSKRDLVISKFSTKTFKIVLDIESYPEYIPWCTKMIINQTQNMGLKKFLININLFYLLVTY